MLNKTLIVRIINNNENFYTAESEIKNLADKTLVIPYEIFESKNDKPIDPKFAYINLGLVTYARVVSERDNTIILDRQVVVDEKSEDFIKNKRVGDKITCQYRNSVYKENELVGIYVMYDKTVKGFIPKNYLKNIDKLYKLNEDIEGFIISINSKKEFILSEFEINIGENLIAKNTYLGKLIEITPSSYVFDCNGGRVICDKNLELEINTYARIFIRKTKTINKIKFYYGRISG